MNWLKIFLPGREVVKASHPGRIRANLRHVFGSYPLWPTMLALGWLISLVAVLDGFHWGACLLLAVATYANYAYWSLVPSWFARGDVCAGVVVDEQPLLVASFTDLTTGEGTYPAVKIRREPARRFPGETGKYGKRVASIAMYDGSYVRNAACWPNFHPRAAQCATDNLAEVQRLLREITPYEWNALQQCVRRLPRPFKPGLYRLTDDG